MGSGGFHAPDEGAAYIPTPEEIEWAKAAIRRARMAEMQSGGTGSKEPNHSKREIQGGFSPGFYLQD